MAHGVFIFARRFGIFSFLPYEGVRRYRSKHRECSHTPEKQTAPTSCRVGDVCLLG